MSTLFAVDGVDIAKLIDENLSPRLLDATLVKVTAGTRTPGSLTAGTNSTTVNHACKGFIEDYKSDRVDGTVIQFGDRMVILVANSISSGTVEPVGQDQVIIEGDTYRIVNVERDPAAATYTCQARI